MNFAELKETLNHFSDKTLTGYDVDQQEDFYPKCRNLTATYTFKDNYFPDFIDRA